MGVRQSSRSSNDILTPNAIDFISKLHRTFNPKREALLSFRQSRQNEFNSNHLPDFLKDSDDIRKSAWHVSQAPSDLKKRHVEITGPVEAKMMINALNSGADVFMADFEDSLSPTWGNVIQGQRNLIDAVRHTLVYGSSDEKKYSLKNDIATLLVRPRGWHLTEKNFCVEGQPISASLFDLGLYCFHNGMERVQQNKGLYFYIPKLENHLEARLWNDVFDFIEKQLLLPRRTIQVTVLIETITAAFEMEEILYELKDHIVGLNAGRWDYIFSIIKKFSRHHHFILPDRAQVTMTVPFMRAYTTQLVKTCLKRGASPIGGMAAFVPSRKDSKVNELALAKVTEDKEREVRDGFHGTWVAHPDLVAVARSVFEKKEEILRHHIVAPQDNNLNGPHNRAPSLPCSAQDLLDVHIPNGQITIEGIQNNISVSLQYLNAWLEGIGASAIYNLMEDVATAEIARSQLWQWRYHHALLSNGQRLTPDLYTHIRNQELDRLGGISHSRYKEVVELLDGLVLSDSFSDFLTLSAYPYL